MISSLSIYIYIYMPSALISSSFPLPHLHKSYYQVFHGSVMSVSIVSFGLSSSISSPSLIFESKRFPSTQFLHSRKLLQHTLLVHKAPPPVPVSQASQNSSSESSPSSGNFDTNLVMIMAVLLCALICALGLNSVIRCALRCSYRADPTSAAAARAAATGIKKKALQAFPTESYSAGLNMPGLANECAICLSEFVPGEKLRILPKCHHGFHLRCIDKWLAAHSSCPTCRQCLLDTCKKIVGCESGSRTIPPVQVVMPLEPEGLIANYRPSC